jgi:uncharacterized SAM-dependent methyltransferase
MTRTASALFERICEQPEYYLTRVELEVLEHDVAEMARAIGERALVVEYGSGSGIKTRLLLEALRDPVAYVPVELSEAALATCVDSLSRALPSLEIPAALRRFRRAARPAAHHARRARVVVFLPGLDDRQLRQARRRSRCSSVRARSSAPAAAR